MSTLKARVSGAWTDTGAVGAARVAGVWVPFGPPSGELVYERLAWAEGPAVTDQQDGDQAYNMGIQFSITNAKLCGGVNWRVPDQILNPPGGVHVASLWTAGGSRLRFVNISAPSIITGGYQDFPFVDGGGDPDPVMLTPGSYVAAIWTIHYVFRASGGVYPSSPSGNVVATSGRLHVDSSGSPNAFPELTSGTLFYVSPLVAV